jgi:transglutaminase-like putative cysteine protease
MLMRKFLILVVSGLLATASLARADLLTHEVDQDLFFAFLNGKNPDRFQQAFATLGVHPAPPMLNDDEQQQLLPAAKILWNREYELRRLPRMIKNLAAQQPQDPVKIAKAERELKNQPALLEKAKNIYNKRVDDISTERATATFKNIPSLNSQIAKCQNTAPHNQPEQAEGSGNTISDLAKNTAKVVQANIQNEQTNDPHSNEWKEASSNLQSAPSAQELAGPGAKLSSVVAPLFASQTARPQLAPSAPIPATVQRSVPAPVSRATAAPLSVPRYDLSNLSDESVQNSRFQLIGTTPSPNQGVELIIHKEGDDSANVSSRQSPHVVSDVNGHFTIPGDLLEGAGTYTVDVKFQNFALQNSYDNVKSVKVENQDNKDAQYLVPSDHVQSDDPKIMALSAQIVTRAGASTDLEKAKAIHDWISVNVRYDSQELKQMDDQEETTWKRTALDVLNQSPQPAGVCYGQSLLFAALARAQGLPTKVDSGNVAGGTHAWNEVLVGGSWKPIDTTWDDGIISGGREVAVEKYFDMSTGSFDKEHQATETMDY